MTRQKKLELRYSHGEPSAKLLYIGPNLRKAVPRWFPALSGVIVRLNDGPPNGYKTREEAIKAAWRYHTEYTMVMAHSR